MNTLSKPTLWEMMSALASDAYELRTVAPGEFELVAIEPEPAADTPSLSDEARSNQTSDSESAEA
jgi:hypothetical protein